MPLITTFYAGRLWMGFMLQRLCWSITHQLPPLGCRCFADALAIGAAVLGTPVKPTIKEVDKDLNVIKTLQRAKLWEVQTPQVRAMEAGTGGGARVDGRPGCPLSPSVDGVANGVLRQCYYKRVMWRHQRPWATGAIRKGCKVRRGRRQSRAGSQDRERQQLGEVLRGEGAIRTGGWMENV